MSFPAFLEHFGVYSENHKSLFFFSVSIIFKKILLIIAPLIKRGSLPTITVYCIYCDDPCSLLIVWGLHGPWCGALFAHL